MPVSSGKIPYHNPLQLLEVKPNSKPYQSIDAVGIREIARILEVAHSAPANHFKNKKPVDIESQAIVLRSFIHGYALLRLDGNENQAVDDVTGIKGQVAVKFTASNK
jgi:hypothetical protein